MRTIFILSLRSLIAFVLGWYYVHDPGGGGVDPKSTDGYPQKTEQDPIINLMYPCINNFTYKIERNDNEQLFLNRQWIDLLNKKHILIDIKSLCIIHDEQPRLNNVTEGIQYIVLNHDFVKRGSNPMSGRHRWPFS
jgi:hypothetical protein